MVVCQGDVFELVIWEVRNGGVTPQEVRSAQVTEKASHLIETVGIFHLAIRVPNC